MKQGPNAGRTWPSETVSITDRNTGVEIRRRTSYRGHNWHLYFTDNGWWDEGRQLLFNGERANQPNLYSLHLESGEITQLTDLGIEPPLPHGRQLRGGGVSFARGGRRPGTECFYFGIDDAFWCVDLRSGEIDHVWTSPDGQTPGKSGLTADGRYLCTVTKVQMRECWPDWCDGYHSRIHRIDLEAGSSEVIHEDDACIGHVNTSPTRPELLSFCHEGAPWRLESRIWGLNVNSGETWAIRPLTEREAVNHEWWYADGEHLGFMASRGEKYRETCVGRIRWDSTDHQEWPAGPHCTHYYGNSTDLIVGDGSREQPFLHAWSLRDGEWLGPKVICRHGSSFNSQKSHPHPRLAPDNSCVVFSTDASDYANLHMIDLPPFDELPDWPLADPRNF